MRAFSALAPGSKHAASGVFLGILLAICAIFAFPSQRLSANEPTSVRRIHQGVASCAGSMCHGHSVADGAPIRGDEILRWQEESSPTGAHARAYRVLREPRGAAIIRRMGLDGDGVARNCLGCHASPGSGPQLRTSEGVDCETCHGPARGWLASHYTVGATHARNISQGMTRLEDPATRASICLDCHFGSDERQGQFVTHRIMAAGHPRISFELDLFTTLQQHHDEDADYLVEADGSSPRKPRTNAMRFWAVGQAMALDRSLTLFSNARLGSDGMFPEFYFYDCHSCHRRISDDADASLTVLANPGRPLPAGYPPYNDENIIMLSAAARVIAPDLAGSFDERSRAFHRAMPQGRAETISAASALRASANQLAARFATASFGREQTFAIMDTIASNAISERFTDYEGAVQSVMAIDTLLNGLVNQEQVTPAAARALRVQINLAYAAVRDPNGFQPIAFRRALGGAIRAIRGLR